MTYAVRPAWRSDAMKLGPALREEDKAEIAASSGEQPAVAILSGIEAGPAWVAEDTEGLLGIFGVVPSNYSTIGHPWMLATPLLLKHQRAFLRECKQRVEQLQGGYEVLTNVVDARNEVHLKWLRWCGFKLTALIPHYGVEQRPFWQFVRTKTQCADPQQSL